LKNGSAKACSEKEFGNILLQLKKTSKGAKRRGGKGQAHNDILGGDRVDETSLIVAMKARTVARKGPGVVRSA